jgi:ubiquitin carboxyl-terminal hydrolase L5
MAPKKTGTKRKAHDDSATAVSQNGGTESKIPDFQTWPGWVEMESEPAYFNVMLRDLGVVGVKVEEPPVLDRDMLAQLSQPIHAFIFLYRYRELLDPYPAEQSSSDHIWFANQLPDNACATFAILNIVNNIPGLILGNELSKFKEFTQDMTPVFRGDAVDNFQFVKTIHNSFARDKDLLEADMRFKEKFEKAKKRAAAAKGRATKMAKKAAQEAKLEEQSEAAATSGRTAKSTGRKNARASRQSPSNESDDDFRPSAKGKNANKGKQANGAKQADPENAEGDHAAAESDTVLESPMPTNSEEGAPAVGGPRRSGREPKWKRKNLNEPGNSDDDFQVLEDAESDSKTKDRANGVRRSTREPKPRKDVNSSAATEEDEAAFHFVAYMPIAGRVWMLDGMDNFPHDLGPIDEYAEGGWMDIAVPHLEARMAVAGADGDHSFSLMAIVHDKLATQRNDLVANVKALQTINKKLDGVMEGWEEMEGGETTKDTIVAASEAHRITAEDLASFELDGSLRYKIDDANDLLELLSLRKELLQAQRPLRGAVRDGFETVVQDDKKARDRRHNYPHFIRSWLGILGEQGVLDEMVQEADAMG